MRRLVPAGLALAVLLAGVPVAHAQLGDLVKKKAVEKATGKKDTTAAAGAKAKPKCDASSLVITADVVDRYLEGAAAVSVMEQKLAKEPGPTGAYYAALLKRRAIEKRKEEFDLRRGPDWEKSQALQKRLQQGDTAAITAYSAFSQSINPNSVEVPQVAWETQQKTNATMDSTARAAGKFSDCDWLALSERLPRLVYIIAQDASAKDFQGFGTAGEAAVVKPRIAELARAMNIQYDSPGVLARRKQLKEEDEARAAAPPTSGDPYVDCMARVQGEYLKAHQKEFDAASEKQDVAVLMQLSQAAAAEAMKKCPRQ
jgi:hypothetical protein